MNYQQLLEDIYAEINQAKLNGETASYIPQLKNIDGSKFGITLITNNGEIYTVGDANEKFSIQSISKVLTLSMAFPVLKDNLWQRVGVEPSGNAFNSLAQLEFENGIPRNPLINAGALVITDIIRKNNTEPINSILSFIGEISGEPGISFNETMAKSELKHSSRNKALAHFMKSFKNIESKVDKLITTYCNQCAIEMTCTELAKAFLLFANHGFSIYSNKQVLTKSETKRINAIMQTCGFYDEAGEFTFKVGLPGKSGVGGGIAAVLPEKFSVVVWSPELNSKGNSVKGMKTLELLTTKLGYSIF